MRSIARRTIWRYPRPRGLLGNLGFDASSGFQHVKVETFEGAERVDKTFGYRYRAGGRWIREKPDWADAVPYRAEELRSAVVGDGRIWITEGEADADALADLGEVATSSHRGAEGWTPKMAQWFISSWWSYSVVIVADRDPTGAYVAAKTFGLLRDVGVPERRLAIVLAAPTGLGADARDHFAAGYGLDDFVPRPIEQIKDYVSRHFAEVGSARGGSAPHNTITEEEVEQLAGWKPRRV